MCAGTAAERRGIISLALVVGLTGAMTPSPALAKSILVVGAHPDDEVLMAAGRSFTALSNGDNIKVVVVTNGDVNGVSRGIEREGESVLSAQALGLSEQDVIFLGYGDQSTRDIYDSASDTLVYTSPAGVTATYGVRGLGGMDYHSHLHGVPGPYNRATMLADFQALLVNYHPDEIYTHNNYDSHPDHQATALFVSEALVSLKRSGLNLATKLYQSIVWMPGQNTSPGWPQREPTGWTPQVPYLRWAGACQPGICLDMTPLEWTRMYRFIQPPAMQLTDFAANVKARAIFPYGSVSNPWFASWARKEEFFWLTDFGTNVAVTAQVTASSENVAAGQGAAHAIDGILNENYKEWVTVDELAGARIQLDWPAPVRVAQVNLHDRPSLAENVLSGVLTFSDGTSVLVGALPANGSVLPITFAPKTVSWVRFTVSQAEGSAIGLAEMQVLGAPATSTANIPPHFIRGPVAAPDSIPASQSTNVSATAFDLDGDPLQYEWSSEAGFIQGNGPNAAFTPPSVTSDTYVAVTVRVLDGRGGSASNSTFIRVTPAPTDSVAVSPSLLFGGDAAQGTVVLGIPAPADGVVVPLASSNTAAAMVPVAVTVPAGATIASFGISTAPVGTTTQVVITAAFPGGTRGAPMTLAPRSISSLTVSPPGVLAGNPAVGTVTLPAPAGPQGIAIQLASADAATASVPSTAFVAAGATTVTFGVTTSSGVFVPTPVTLSATYGNTATAVLTVGPLAASTLVFSPASVVGGSTTQGTVTLNGPATGSGALVTLSSADPATAGVPASVTVPPSAISATFTVTTATVAASTSVSMSASFGGVTATELLSVTP